jgi:hypothetical protein
MASLAVSVIFASVPLSFLQASLQNGRGFPGIMARNDIGIARDTSQENNEDRPSSSERPAAARC